MTNHYIVKQDVVLNFIAGPFPDRDKAWAANDRPDTQWVIDDDSVYFKLIKGIPATITSQIKELESRLHALRAQLPIEIAKRLEGKFEARTGHVCDAEWFANPDEDTKTNSDLTWVIVPVGHPVIIEIAYYNAQYTFYLADGSPIKPTVVGTGKTEEEAWLDFPYESIIGEV
jgi:hypothetical protein